MTVPDDGAAPSAIPNHSAHPGHTLKRVAEAKGQQLFICDGCKEPGAGARYRCEHERCNFDLHTCCAVAPDTLTHPAFGAHRVFLFLQVPEPCRARTGKGGGRSCAAAVCRKPVRGFVYHCGFDDSDGDGIDLHPCCTRQPVHAVIRDDDVRVSALGREAPVASSQRETSGVQSNDRSRKVHRLLPFAIHRQLDGTQAGKQNPPPTENSQLMNNHVLEVRRQEVSRSGDEPVGDRNRGRQRVPAAARHRWWTWKR